MLSEKFQEVATKQKGSSGNDFVDAILNERKELRGHMAYLPYDGNMAHTARIDGIYYKGPKKDKTTEADIDRERRLIQHMEDKVPYIPRVAYVGQQAVFFGVTPVEGVVFEDTVIDMFGKAKLVPAEMKNLAKEMAGFVTAMARAFTDEEATKEFGFKPERPDLEPVRQAMQDPAVRAALGAQLPDCERLMQEYIDAFSQKKPIVMHTDMHLLNCYINPETKALSGIIDFGVVKYCVPEADPFNRLFISYPQDFIKDFCDACEAQGLPVSYRHRRLSQFAHQIEWVHQRLNEGQSPGSFAMREIANFISQLNEMAASAPVIPSRTGSPKTP